MAVSHFSANAVSPETSEMRHRLGYRACSLRALPSEGRRLELNRKIIEKSSNVTRTKPNRGRNVWLRTGRSAVRRRRRVPESGKGAGDSCHRQSDSPQQRRSPAGSVSAAAAPLLLRAQVSSRLRCLFLLSRALSVVVPCRTGDQIAASPLPPLPR